MGAGVMPISLVKTKKTLVKTILFVCLKYRSQISMSSLFCLVGQRVKLHLLIYVLSFIDNIDNKLYSNEHSVSIPVLNLSTRPPAPSL